MLPLSSEHGTYKTVTARFWPWLSGDRLRDHTLAGLLWEGYRESRRCSRDTYPESYITKYTTYTKIKLFPLGAEGGGAGEPPGWTLQGYLAHKKPRPPNVQSCSLLARKVEAKEREVDTLPLSSQHGTYKTAKARFWLWLSGISPLSCSLLARKRIWEGVGVPRS